MEYKFKATSCAMCGADLETAKPAGKVREEPNSELSWGSCPRCKTAQLVVEDKPKAARRLDADPPTEE